MLIVSEADSYAPLRSPQGDQALAERSILDAPPWGSSQNHEAMGDKDRTDATELPLRHSPEGGGDGKSGDGKGGAEKVSGLFCRRRLCRPWELDVSPELISGSLPAGDGHLMSPHPHPRPSPAIERSLFPNAGLAGEGGRLYGPQPGGWHRRSLHLASSKLLPRSGLGTNDEPIFPFSTRLSTRPQQRRSAVGTRSAVVRGRAIPRGK
jgi:hypothetical protein